MESISTLITLSTLVALVISGQQIYKHLTNYSEPKLQLYIIRILLMVPVNYSLFNFSIDLCYCYLDVNLIP